jgi:membrane protease YdiL (CAAX protease family)
MRESIFNKVFGLKILKTDQGVEAVNLKKIKVLRAVFSYFSFLLLIWGLYRFLFKLPEAVEELFLKPIIWLGPLIWLVKRMEKKPLASLGLSSQALIRNIIIGLGLGIIFSLEGALVNIIKYGQLNLFQVPYSGWGLAAAFLTSVATAFSEELAFRGFIFNRLWGVSKKEWQTNLVTSFLFLLIYLPITILIFRYQLLQVLVYSLVVFLYSLGAGFIFARTKTIIAPLLMHVFWAWPMILFR